MDYYKDKLEILLKGLMILILLLTSADGATLTVGPGQTYTTIQAAINAAAPGDTIRVQMGTYHEQVDVNKTLTLQGIGSPVVVGESGNAITLSADNCILEGFVTRNSQSGIRVMSSSNTISNNTATENYNGIYLVVSKGSTVSENKVTSNTYGIRLDSSDGNSLSGNTANSNTYGIFLYSSSGNTLSNNTANSNFYGIFLYSSSSNNTLSGNTATGNSYYGIVLEFSGNNALSINTATGNYNGIYIGSSSNNTISNNIATANTYGIFLDSSTSNTILGNAANDNTNFGIILFHTSNGNAISGNTVTGNNWGISISYSNDNTISDNIATSNGDGISLSGSIGNTISRNTVTGNNNWGIYLYAADENTISSNTANGNNIGIRLLFSNRNTIYLNAFNSGWSNSANNHWNSTVPISWIHDGWTLTGLLGNIWSNYGGFDCEGDGIGDTPYNITGGFEMDYHPIGSVLSSPGLEAQKSADRTQAQVGDWINYTIWVNNTGNVTLTGVQAEDNLTGDVWQVGNLAPGGNYTNTIRYKVNLSDLPGPLTNELQANGTDPCGSEVNDSAIETVNIIGQNLTCIDGYKLDIFGNKLSGWTIFVDKDNDGILDPGEPSDITDSNGYWQICGLDAGEEYNVTEILKTGWIPSDPPSGWQVITVQPNNDTDVNFTNQETTYCIAGQKLNNLTKEPLEGWTITVSNDSKSWQVQTNSTGFWEL